MKEKVIDISKLDTIGIGAKGNYLFRKKDDGFFYIVKDQKEYRVCEPIAIDVLEKEFEEVI